MESDWIKQPYKWNDNGREHISIPFTWQLPQVREDILKSGITPIIGGTAVKLMPDYLADVAEIGGDISGILQKFNLQATKTTIGCPNKCGFCAVSKLEPDYKELDDYPNLPIICDNNLLAASKAHFDKVIDRLKVHPQVDFNQGLDAKLLTQYHADRLAELNATIRLAWDHINNEHYVLQAVSRLRKTKIPRKNMTCYVLIGYKDTPEDALYRCETLWHGLGITPYPMRYIPLDSLSKFHVGENWTEEELSKMQRYWSRLRYHASIPYELFDNSLRKSQTKSKKQELNSCKFVN